MWGMVAFGSAFDEIDSPNLSLVSPEGKQTGVP